MTPDEPEEVRRACSAFLEAHGAPSTPKLMSHLVYYVKDTNEYFGNVDDSDKPPGMSTSAYWLQHLPDECKLMRDIRTAASQGS